MREAIEESWSCHPGCRVLDGRYVVVKGLRLRVFSYPQEDFGLGFFLGGLLLGDPSFSSFFHGMQSHWRLANLEVLSQKQCSSGGSTSNPHLFHSQPQPANDPQLLPLNLEPPNIEAYMVFYRPRAVA